MRAIVGFFWHGINRVFQLTSNAHWFLILAIFGFIISTGCTQGMCKTNTDLAYIHLSQFKPALGGRPSEVEIYYVSSDGVTQTSLEMTDDRILSLVIGCFSVDADFFNHLFKLVSVPSPLDQPDLGVVYDAWPARTRFIIRLYDSSTAFWEGDTSKVPKSIVEAIELVKASIEQSVPQTMINTFRFLRVRQMSQRPSQLPRRSYIVPNSSELIPGGLLATAIEHPHRLIPISDADDIPFAYRRQPNRPVSAVIKNVAYRIHFLELTKN